jgi:hypothetical protein
VAEQLINSGNKILALVISLIVVVVGATIVGYFAFKSLSDRNESLRNEVIQFKQLTESLVRSSNKWVTKDDLENSLGGFITKVDLEEVKKDLKELGAKLTSVGQTIGAIGAIISKPEPSDGQGPENPTPPSCSDGKLIDVFGYTKRVQIKEIKDINTAPVAEVRFNAAEKAPWMYKTYGRQYKIITIVGKKDDGQLTFHNSMKYSIPEKSNTEYNINITSSDFKQAYPSNSWFWFNPIVDLNFFAGGRVYQFAEGPGRNSDASLGVDLGLSLSSFGETKVDSAFRLFRFGFGYNIERQSAQLSFSPITYNIGKPLPLLTNLYVAPQVGVDTNGGINLMLGIGPQF